MLRTIVHINEELCDGCGACARACHEGAIAMVGGKARLMRDDYCDGMGDCLPACPAGAITFERREAAAYDEAAVARAKAARTQAPAPAPHACPGSAPRVLRPQPVFAAAGAFAPSAPRTAGGAGEAFATGAGEPGLVSPLAPAAQAAAPSQLAQWPCQIKLAPVCAPYFAGADLLVAADCTAFACADFHRLLMAGRVTLVGCPKLDAVDYAEKLGAILAANDVRSVTLARMEVPCCGGLEQAARRAIAASGRDIPLAVVTIGCDGRILG